MDLEGPQKAAEKHTESDSEKPLTQSGIKKKLISTPEAQK
jgi:hypothetical protein